MLFPKPIRKRAPLNTKNLEHRIEKSYRVQETKLTCKILGRALDACRNDHENTSANNCDLATETVCNKRSEMEVVNTVFRTS